MLAPYTDELPQDYYSRISHFWILLDGKIEVAPKTPGNGDIHQTFWGDVVWSIPERGYYLPDMGLLTCHGTISVLAEHKLEKKFKEAIYIQKR